MSPTKSVKSEMGIGDEVVLATEDVRIMISASSEGR